MGLQHGGVDANIGLSREPAQPLVLVFVQFTLGDDVQFVLFRGGRDVVDLGVLILGAPILVCVVKTTDWALFDGAAGTTVAILARRLALVFGGRIRAEVAVARAWGRGATSVGPWRKTPRPWREAARARRARTRRRSSRPWTGKPTWPWRSARPALLARTGLAHRKRPPFERLLIELANGRLGDATISVINERKASRPAGLAIDREHYLCRRTHTREMFA